MVSLNASLKCHLMLIISQLLGYYHKLVTGVWVELYGGEDRQAPGQPHGAKVTQNNKSQTRRQTAASYLKAHHKGFSLNLCLFLREFWEHLIILRHVQGAKHSGLIIIIMYQSCALP